MSLEKIVPRSALTAYGLAALVVILDQLSKWWILEVFYLPVKGSQPILGPLNFTFVKNMGVSFGLGAGWAGRWVLVAFAAAVVAFLIVWATKLVRPLALAGVGLVIGGAIGNNLIDRARLGYVVDFIDVSALHFPWVFNIADTAITIGVCLLLLDSLKRDKPAV